MAILPAGWFIRIQNSVVTTDSIPEPDLVVVRGKPGDYSKRHPTGAQIGLVIEVADTTVARDRRKAAIYAKAGIPHYWIVNLDDGQIEIYGNPTITGADAAYQSQKMLRGDDGLTLELDGHAVGMLPARDILG